MGLLQSEEPKERQQSFASRCASKLANVIKKHKLRSERITFRKWVEEFERLEKKHDKDTIQRVLDWYVANITKPYVPEAYSAQSFRKKFDAIKKQVDDQPISENELSPQELVILQRAKRLSWPNGVDALLPKIIKASFTKYSEFRARLSQAIIDLNKKARESPRVQRLACIANHLIATNKLPSPVVFMDNWLSDLSGMVSRGYQPSMARMTFAVNNPEFAKRAAGSVYEYCHDSRLWNELLKEIGVENG